MSNFNVIHNIYSNTNITIYKHLILENDFLKIKNFGTFSKSAEIKRKLYNQIKHWPNQVLKYGVFLHRIKSGLVSYKHES